VTTAIVVAVILVIFFSGIRIIRPTHRALIERLGKYQRFAQPGFQWIIPIIDRLYQIVNLARTTLRNIIGTLTLKSANSEKGKILEAEGEAEAIRLVNEAAEKYFVGNAQVLRKLEAMKTAIMQRLASAGFSEVTVDVDFSGRWSTDMLEESAREKLRSFGIAPPV
jgi:regulator of protease activity HflC (stomatin/prohibitin superfamily)